MPAASAGGADPPYPQNVTTNYSTHFVPQHGYSTGTARSQYVATPRFTTPHISPYLYSLTFSRISQATKNPGDTLLSFFFFFFLFTEGGGKLAWVETGEGREYVKEEEGMGIWGWVKVGVATCC